MLAGLQSFSRLALIVAAAGLAACSSSSTGLTTGTLSSLMPGSKAKESDPAVERAFQVASTAARAQKCGYNFDPARLRTAYLAFESTQAGGAEKLAGLEKRYDFTQGQVAKALGKADEYCSDETTGIIKSDLTRHLAGDYTPSKKAAGGSTFDWLQSNSSSEEWDKKKALCPKMNCV